MKITTDIPITENMLGKIKGLLKIERIGARIGSVSTDSREVGENDLFFALKGERTDGEDYIKDAKAKGAITVSARDPDADIFVESVGDALLSLSEIYKDATSPKATVAITGSVGKTTTKDLCAAILSASYKVHATPGNFNNDIGVPFTIFSMPKDTEILIAEVGMNHKGELRRLAKTLKPSISVITKIGTAHIGNLGSRRDIAEAKCEIIDREREGSAIIPFGEPLLSHIGGKRVSLTDPRADYLLSHHPYDGKFDFLCDRFSLSGVSLNLKGAHVPECLAFAIAVAESLGQSVNDIRRGAEGIHDIERAAHITKIGDIRIIDDSYNASLESITAALKTLTLESGRHIAVIGDVLELADTAESIHLSIGEACAKSGISFLFTFGEYAEVIARGAYRAGMPKHRVHVNRDLNAPRVSAEALRAVLRPDDIVLFKASHRIGINRITDAIRNT